MALPYTDARKIAKLRQDINTLKRELGQRLSKYRDQEILKNYSSAYYSRTFSTIYRPRKAHPGQPFRFFDLPAEVQSMIIEEIKWSRDPDESDDDENEHEVEDEPNIKALSPLRLACRELNAIVSPHALRQLRITNITRDHQDIRLLTQLLCSPAGSEVEKVSILLAWPKAGKEVFELTSCDILEASETQLDGLRKLSKVRDFTYDSQYDFSSNEYVSLDISKLLPHFQSLESLIITGVNLGAVFPNVSPLYWPRLRTLRLGGIGILDKALQIVKTHARTITWLALDYRTIFNGPKNGDFWRNMSRHPLANAEYFEMTTSFNSEKWETEMNQFVHANGSWNYSHITSGRRQTCAMWTRNGQ